MVERNIFLSVGTPSNEAQDRFVRAVEDRLRSEGLNPRTVGRNTFSSGAPLKKVIDLLDDCQGAVVIALERSFFPSGFQKRGGPDETQLLNVKLPTPWNQIEAGMAYSRHLPLMMIVESGLQDEGLLKNDYDWYVQRVKPDSSTLTSLEFNSILADWKTKVDSYKPTEAISVAGSKSVGDGTIIDLIGSLRPAQLWSSLTAFAVVISGAFALGANLIDHLPFLNANKSQISWVDTQTNNNWGGLDYAYTLTSSPKYAVNGAVLCDAARLGYVATCWDSRPEGYPGGVDLTDIPRGTNPAQWCTYKNNQVRLSTPTSGGPSGRVYVCAQSVAR